MESESANMSSLLPAELLERIFLLLQPRHLASAVLVCRRWREVGENPGLWSSLHLTVTEFSLPHLPELLGCGRLRRVRQLTLKAVSDQLLNQLADHTGHTRAASLKSLNMANTNLSAVKVEVLVFAVLQVREVVLRGSGLSLVQLNGLFTALATCSPHLESLDLSELNLCQVEPKLLTASLFQLEVVSLARCRLTSLQLASLCSSLSPSRALRCLDLSHNNLSLLPPSLLAGAVACLRELQLWGASLQPGHLNALCQAMAQGGRLKRLDLTGNNLSSLEPGLLASGVGTLREVTLVTPG